MNDVQTAARRGPPTREYVEGLLKEAAERGRDSEAAQFAETIFDRMYDNLNGGADFILANQALEARNLFESLPDRDLPATKLVLWKKMIEAWLGLEHPPTEKLFAQYLLRSTAQLSSSLQSSFHHLLRESLKMTDERKYSIKKLARFTAQVATIEDASHFDPEVIRIASHAYVRYAPIDKIAGMFFDQYFPKV